MQLPEGPWGGLCRRLQWRPLTTRGLQGTLGPGDWAGVRRPRRSLQSQLCPCVSAAAEAAVPARGPQLGLDCEAESAPVKKQNHRERGHGSTPTSTPYSVLFLNGFESVTAKNLVTSAVPVMGNQPSPPSTDPQPVGTRAPLSIWLSSSLCLDPRLLCSHLGLQRKSYPQLSKAKAGTQRTAREGQHPSLHQPPPSHPQKCI